MTDEQPPNLPPQQLAPHYQSPSKPTPNQGPDPDYVSMESSGFSHILNHLLKKPLSVIHEINKGERSPIPALLIITLVCLAIFGLVLGMFSAGTQLWASPVKVIGGVFFSGLICLPSLYIFGALGGMDAKLQHVVGLMLTFLAITSLLLVGFAPVVWLFSTSSNSLVFFGILSLIIWIVCLIFGLRVITRASKSMGGGHGGHLKIWAVIFMLVTLQMTTTLRPIIGESESGRFLNLEEKRFFMRYWLEVIDDESQSPKKSNHSSDTKSPPTSESKRSSEQKPSTSSSNNPYLSE